MNEHIAFSHGIHFHPGVPLARPKARVVLKDQRFEFVAHAWFRGPTKLWAEWSPARTEAGS